FLPPLGAPKRHVITHHCIQITNNKRSTACSRCHRGCGRRSRCRCSRRCSCGCRCRRKCRCGCGRECRCRRRRKRCCPRRRRRGNVAVNERGALEKGADDGIEEKH